MDNEWRLQNMKHLLNEKREPYRNVICNRLNSKNRLCLFPCGVGSRFLINYLKSMDIVPDFISDNNREKLVGDIEGIPCITVDDLWRAQKDDVTILVESLQYQEIKKGLECRGFTNIQRIYFGKEQASEWLNHNLDSFSSLYLDLLNLLGDERSKDVVDTILSSWIMNDISDNHFEQIYDKDQYFDSDIIQLSTEESFVDCGAYTGDTTDTFLEHIPEFRGSIYQFELDPDIYQSLCRNMEKYKNIINIKHFPFGTAEKEAEIELEVGNRSSHVMATGGGQNSVKGKIIALDDLLERDKITFIKMDIEGSEWDALHGARRIIQEQKPILAVCLYHKPEDLFRIPKYMKKLVPDYDIYIRHYTDMLWETVCYAVAR